MRKAGWVAIQLAVILLLCGRALASYDFVDDSGQAVAVSAPFKRIVSLYPAHTENLFMLGLDKEIVGVSTGDDYPPEAAGKVRFTYRDDPERLIAVKPDLVLIRPMIFRGHRAFVSSLQAAGITVVSLQPNTVEEMFEYWKRLGALTGRSMEADESIDRFTRGLQQIRDRVAHVPESQRPRVYFESVHSKMKTFSPESMAVFALENAGGIDVARDAKPVRGTNIAEYGKERILARAGEIDVYLAQNGTMNRVTVDDVVNEPGFGAIKAVQQRKVFLVDETMVSRPTMRLLEGIGAVQRLLYPDPGGQQSPVPSGARGASK